MLKKGAELLKNKNERETRRKKEIRKTKEIALKN